MVSVIEVSSFKLLQAQKRSGVLGTVSQKSFNMHDSDGQQVFKRTRDS